MSILNNLNIVDSAGKFLFVGPPGGGKSCALASFPKPKIFDYDERIKGVYPLIRSGVITQDVEFTQVPYPAGWATHQKELDEMKLRIMMDKTKYDSFKTYGFDSLTNMLRLFIAESLDLQKGQIVLNPQDPTTKGKPAENFGQYSLRLEGPGDYKYAYSAIKQIFDVTGGLHTGIYNGVKINIIFTAHQIDVMGKPDLPLKPGQLEPEPDVFAENVKIGTKIYLSDKFSPAVLSRFDEIYEFSKDGRGHFSVKFNGDIGHSVLIPGDFKSYDITGKNFYQFWKNMVEKINPKREETNA